MKRALALTAAAAALALAGTATASTLTGTFDIKVYNYDAGGSSANASATTANVAAHTAVGEVTYTGALDFFLSGSALNSTIGAFLATGTGGSYIVNGSSGFLNDALSAGNMTTTTLLDIYATITGPGTLTITHDDGVSVCNNGTCQGNQAVAGNSAWPTVAVPTQFNVNSGSLRIIYSAANGNPEQLNVSSDGVNVVPLPAAGFLLVGGFGALAGLKRRRKSA